jgi:hypothetical protein
MRLLEIQDAIDQRGAEPCRRDGLFDQMVESAMDVLDAAKRACKENNRLYKENKRARLSPSPAGALP